ncbi:MAG: hypothetical protein PHI98_14555 [Eubacteriales bacterium]|nr:hypothetical protein [Eubacteriales bacterium]
MSNNFRTGSGRWLTVLCCFLLVLGLASAAQGEDYFTLDVDALDMNQLNSNDYVAQHLSAQAQGICVIKQISDSSELAQTVRLTLTQMDTKTVVIDRDFGYQSCTFNSGVIYLPYVDNRTIPYLVTLYVGDTVYAMPFMQLQPRLEYNGACTYGVRLRDLDDGLSQDWLMGTMLDLNEMRMMGVNWLNICASNAYVIGQATVSMEGDNLSVQLNLDPSANVEVQGLSLYVITDCSQINGDPAYMGLSSVGVGEWINVAGAASALLYMPMQVSYNPAGLPTFQYDLNGSELQNQLNLWYENRSGDRLTTWPEETAVWPEDNSWVSDQNIGWVDPTATAVPYPETVPPMEQTLEPFLTAAPVETAVPPTEGVNQIPTEITVTPELSVGP